VKRPLERYAAKRRFRETPEPGARLPGRREGPLLFVVQKHAARRLHYDFRLELDGVLKSWAVPKGPSSSVTDKRMAVEVEDHPFDYGSFEGVIPARQYGAGNVIVWDCGVYSPDEQQRYSFNDRAEAQARVREELARGKLSFFLRGEKLKGSYTLVRTREDKQWLLIKHQDRYARDNELLARGESVLSGGSVEGMAGREVARLPAETLAPAGPRERLPAKLSPMLAEAGDSAHTDPDWLYEPKLDGYRVLAFVRGSNVRLQSRRGMDLSAAFPEITAELAQQADAQMLLDGEVVALDATGRPSFNALQNRVQLKTAAQIAAAQRESPVVYVCFDLLHFGGVDVRGATYVDRRRYLTQCLLPAAHLQRVHAAGDAESLLAAALAGGFEGIVAKRRNSSYQPGKRSGAWVKYKRSHTIEFVVGGYTRGKGERERLGALLLGYWIRPGALRYAGHVGSGLSAQLIDELQRRIAADCLERRRSPFDADVELHRPTRWLEPRLVAEVSFTEWTPDGLLRAPVFVRLRDDVAAADISTGPDMTAGAPASARARSSPARAAAARSTAQPSPASAIEAVLQQLDNKLAKVELSVEGARIRMTHLDRVYWPASRGSPKSAVTKRDLIRYLASVSPLMLPHLKDRPLTMIRMPEGINGERFFQKHWDQAKPDFVETVEVFSDHKDEKHRYILANNLPTLLWLGQNGTLEFHVWHSRAHVDADCITQRTDYSSSLSALKDSVLNYPDYLVFDIDPYIYSGSEPAGAEPELNKRGFAVGRRVAFWLRALLQEMSLDALVKTSGKTGLHVFVPIERTVTFDTARHLCETVGRHLMKAHPKEITMDWAVQKRAGRIFIDYNMNVRGKTLNVAYSPRGIAGAPISMPLSWEELEAAEVMDFTIASAPGRLAKAQDRWQDALAKKYSLSRALAQDSDN
jgi:bifunctional non-homologous end joining protein LigD